jgi:hypothetical protein
MWIFSQDGFISAVFKAGKLQLRARDRESLKRMGFTDRRIRTGEGTDYPFRVYTTKRELKRLVCKQIDAIEYPNFKSRIRTTRGRVYENALHGVWSAMLAVEPKDALQLLNNRSWRAPVSKGSRVADWWPEYDRAVNGIALEDRDVPEGFSLVDHLSDDELREYDAMLEETPKSLHDMTDEEWEAWLEGRPGGV